MRLQQFFDPRSLNRLSKPLGGFLLALLAALVVAGCGGGTGSDRGSFVAPPGTDGGPTGVGSVTYSFVKALNGRIEVPASTQSLRFDFYTGQDGTGTKVKTETRPYADEVTITGVPVTVRSSIVTALDGDGFPTYEFRANHTVEIGQNTIVDIGSGLGQAVELTGLRASPEGLSLGLDGEVQLQILAVFSNQDVVPITGSALSEVEFASSDEGIATVSTTGTVSAVLQGDAVITATFRGQTVQVFTIVGTGNVIPPGVSSLSLDITNVAQPAGTVSPPITATATFDNGNVRTVTQGQGLLWSSDNPGVSVDAENRVVISGDLAPDTTAVVTFTYLGQSANVQVLVQDGVLQSISAEPASITLPFGGFEQTVAVFGTFSTGEVVEISPAELTYTESSANFNVSPQGVVVTTTAGTAGTEDFVIALDANPTLSVSVPVEVGTIVVNSLTVTPNAPVLGVGDFVEFEVIANLSNGTTFDISDFAALQTSFTGSGIVINQGRIVAVEPDTTATVTITLPGAGPNGTDATRDVVVTVQKLQLTEVTYLFAGNPVSDQNSVNLPRGYVGIFQVEGTFNNGATRLLRPSEYELQELNEDRNGVTIPFADRPVALFDTTYNLPGVHPDFDYPEDTGTVANASRLLRPVRAVVTFNPADPNFRSSNDTQVVVSDSFRAVVADWRRAQGPLVDPNAPDGQYDGIAQNNLMNVGMLNYYIIHVDDDLEPDDDPDAFTSNPISVTVTDPDPDVTLAGDSGVFANYPEDNRMIDGIPREFEFRVDFNPRTVQPQGRNPMDPAPIAPSVNAQPGFKLAEANVQFETDSTVNPNLLRHRPDEFGFPTIVSDNAIDIAAIDFIAAPVGGINMRNGLNTFSADTPTWQPIFNIFGPGGNITPIPFSGEVATYNGWSLGFVRTLERVDNGGETFRILAASTITLDPIASTIQVGGGQLFRTMVRFGTQLPLEDRSQDYRPVMTDDTHAVSSVDDAGGLVVNGTSVGSTQVQVLDPQGQLIAPRGGNVQDSLGTVGPASTTVDVDIVPIP